MGTASAMTADASRLALSAVRRWGGVLEHPAHSYAWRAFGLPRPKRGLWVFDGRGFTTEVAQSAYGHRARKATWLYYVGTEHRRA